MTSRLCLFLVCLSLFSTTKATMAEKTALLIATDGSEEMEVVITADVLVRGGVKVTIAGLNGTQPFKCARGTKIVPDAAFEDAKTGSYDVIILPGGQPGSNTLAAHEGVGFLLREQHEKGKLVAAICAAPIALKSHKIPADLVTSHPSVQKQLEEAGYKYSTDRVVVSDKVVTSRGPGTAFEFGLKLVELLNGAEKANSLIEPMLLKL